MVKVKWYKQNYFLVGDELRKTIEEQLKEKDISEFQNLREFEETGDEYILPKPDPREEGIFASIVMHEGKLRIVVGNVECGGYIEAYYVGEIIY